MDVPTQTFVVDGQKLEGFQSFVDARPGGFYAKDTVITGRPSQPSIDLYGGFDDKTDIGENSYVFNGSQIPANIKIGSHCRIKASTIYSLGKKIKIPDHTIIKNSFILTNKISSGKYENCLIVNNKIFQKIEPQDRPQFELILKMEYANEEKRCQAVVALANRLGLSSEEMTKKDCGLMQKITKLKGFIPPLNLLPSGLVPAARKIPRDL